MPSAWPQPLPRRLLLSLFCLLPHCCQGLSTRVAAATSGSRGSHHPLAPAQEELYQALEHGEAGKLADKSLDQAHGEVTKEARLKEFTDAFFSFQARLRDFEANCTRKYTELRCNATSAVMERLQHFLTIAITLAGSPGVNKLPPMLHQFQEMPTIATRLFEHFGTAPFAQLWSGVAKNAHGELEKWSFSKALGPGFEECGMSEDEVEFMFEVADADNSRGLSREEFIDYLGTMVETGFTGIAPLDGNATDMRSWAGALSL